MTMQELLPQLADIHNRLTEISVRGDDTIRMGSILQRLRTIVSSINEELEAEDSETK